MLRAPEEGASDSGNAGGPFRYSLSDKLSAGAAYTFTRLPETASDQQLREYRLGGFTTTAERDVLDLGLSLDLDSSSSVGVGYQLHSTRPDAADQRANGTILPGSDGVDHAVTFGVQKSWGAND